MGIYLNIGQILISLLIVFVILIQVKEGGSGFDGLADRCFHRIRVADLGIAPILYDFGGPEPLAEPGKHEH